MSSSWQLCVSVTYSSSEIICFPQHFHEEIPTVFLRSVMSFNLLLNFKLNHIISCDHIQNLYRYVQKSLSNPCSVWIGQNWLQFKDVSVCVMDCTYLFTKSTRMLNLRWKLVVQCVWTPICWVPSVIFQIYVSIQVILFSLVLYQKAIYLAFLLNLIFHPFPLGSFNNKIKQILENEIKFNFQRRSLQSLNASHCLGYLWHIIRCVLSGCISGQCLFDVFTSIILTLKMKNF